jgi:hypothetical protein
VAPLQSVLTPAACGRPPSSAKKEPTHDSSSAGAGSAGQSKQRAGSTAAGTGGERRSGPRVADPANCAVPWLTTSAASGFPNSSQSETAVKARAQGLPRGEVTKKPPVLEG